jgi:MftR C-terminal domain
VDDIDASATLASWDERRPLEVLRRALGGFLLQPRGVLALADTDAASEQLRTIARVITESPALLARERQVFDRYTQSLAALIAQETAAARDDIEPRAIAGALVAVHRALIDYVRRRTIAGASAHTIAHDLRAQATRALTRLEHGLGDYPPPTEDRSGSLTQTTGSAGRPHPVKKAR